MGGVISATEIKEETTLDKESGVDAGSGSGEDSGTGKETGSGEETETGGETGSGEETGTGGETGSDEGTGEDGETGSDEGTGEDGETGSDEGTGNDGETGSDEGTGDDDGKNPGEGTGDGEDTDPGENDGTGEDMNPDEGDVSDGESDPDGEDGADEDDIESEETDEEEEGELEEEKLASLEAAALSASDFTIDTDGKLTKYNGTGGAVEIPAEVKTIGSNVFKNNTSITSVTIPGTVVSIESGAFSGCTKLVKVTLNEGLQTIGKDAFRSVAFGEKAITGAIVNSDPLMIPSTVTMIGTSAFRDSACLETVVFEDGSTELVMSSNNYPYEDDGPFRNCKALKRVTLPDRLVNIQRSTFAGCSALEEVQFGQRLKSIEDSAFVDCISLQAMNFPASLESIGIAAFSGCTNLIKVSLNEGLKTIGKDAFRRVAFGETDITGAIVNSDPLMIPGTVTMIGPSAFRDSACLETVEFKNGTTELVISSDNYPYEDDGPFRDCKALKRVTLPDQLVNIQRSTFAGCSALEEVQFGQRLKSIEDSAFVDCISLQAMNFPASLESIGIAAFSGCTNLIKVSLNEGLKTIGKDAFRRVAFGETDITGAIVNSDPLMIPGSVTMIGPSAFRDSACLEEVKFENGATELVMSADNYPYTEEGPFKNCKALKRVTLPDQLVNMPQYTFAGCSALEEVQFGKNLKSIGDSAFVDCINLQAVDFPASLESIGVAAFSGCTKLAKVSLNEGLKTIGKDAFRRVAFGETDITGAIVNSDPLMIPGSVTMIGPSAFRDSACLEEVKFENGATELVMSANNYPYTAEGPFKNCKALKRVTLPDHLVTMPQNTFDGCTSLEEVQFGVNLKSIGNSAFEGCSSLQWLYPQDSLETIEANAFTNCKELTILYIPQKVTKIGDNILKNSPKAVIYGFSGSTAETYAEKNNIPFREAGGEGWSVTGISLNRSRITVAGDSFSDSTILLRATVRPSSARNKRVSFTSSDEGVASVSAQGKVTINGYGTAVITATTEDGGKTARCTVEVLRKWTEAEKEAIKARLQELNASKLTVVTNVCQTVADIELALPTEYELKSAEWRLKEYAIADGARPIYDVIVKREGYQDAVITGLTITGITVEDISIAGAAKLQNGANTDLMAEIETAGGNLPEGSYDPVEWSISGSAARLENKSGNTATVSGVSGGTVSVTAKLTVKHGDKKVTISSPSFRITVTNDRLASSIDITTTENGATVPIDSPIELEDLKEAKEYILSASVRDGKDEVIDNPSLQWKSSNTKVAEVKGQGSGVTLKIKTETGAAVISVTANKNGGYTKTFRVVVKDSTPRLEETGINLNLNQNTPTATVHIVPSYGYEVSGEGLSVVLADGSRSGFTIEKMPDSATEYQIGGAKDLKTGKYKVHVRVKTGTGESAKEHTLPLTISVVKQIPKVTLTQDNIVNLYEVDAEETKILISAEAKIDEVRYTPSVGVSSNKPKLVLGSDLKAEYITLKTANLNKSNYGSTSLKGTFEITFEGYDKSVVYKKSFTVKANKKVPAIQAVPAGTVLYTGSAYEEVGLNTTTVSFNLKADGSEITKETGWSMELQSGISGVEQVEASSQAQPLTIKLLDRARKSTTLKFKVRNEGWFEGVTATASCTVKKGSAPEMGFSNNKVTLNATQDADRADPLKIDLFVKNQPERKIRSVISIEGKNEAANDALSDRINISFENGKLEVSIREQASFSKNTKYTYVITGRDQKGAQVSGRLDVTVSTQAMKLTLKQSGSIDLLNREGTQITLKPTLKNYTDTVKKVDLYGGYADRFSAVCENGNIVIKAENDSILKVKTTYNLSLRIVLESGVVQYGKVKITPKQTNPKLAVNPTKTVLFESAAGDTYGKEIEVKAAKGVLPEIKSIELTNGSDSFVYKYEGGTKGTLHVSPNASSKTNKTYKLKFAVRFKDSGSNAAPVYVTVSVNYRK